MTQHFLITCLSALVALTACATPGAAPGRTETLEALMPEYSTDQPEAYLCTSVQLPDRPLKLTGFEPLSKREVVHHMLLFGCDEPANDASVWDCHTHSVCREAGSHVLYGWAMGAEAVQLPEGVGFRVGQGTGSRHLVLQVHYAHLRPEGDHSGIRLKLTDEAVPFAAGVMMYASFFQIPPHTPSHLVSTKCCLSGFEPTHGFAFRVHTHSLGRSVYLDRLGSDAPGAPPGGPARTRLVEHSPQLPQGFTPINNLTFWPGDRLEQTCDYNSSERDSVTFAGASHSNEMCNLYMMMWSELPVFLSCAGMGPMGDNPEVDRNGPGGLPANMHVVEELPEHWQPPAPQSAELGDGAPGETTLERRVASIGQVSGVAKGLDGTVWVFHRGGREWGWDSFDEGGAGRHITYADPIPTNTVYQLDQDTGEVLREWGAGLFYMPHMVTLDREGNVWLVDTGAHTVAKFSPEGRRLLLLGTPLGPGSDERTFCKPTHVAVEADGTVFVADGYCNARLLRFTAGGDFLGAYELPEREGGPMAVPHSLVVKDCERQVLVADREHSKVHAFDMDGRAFLGTWDLSAYGKVYALTAGPYGATLALTWNQGAGMEGPEVQLVWLDSLPGIVGAWALPGVESPHDLALVASPLRLAGESRPLAALVAETRGGGGSRLRKFIILPEGQELDPSLPAGIAARQQWAEVRAAYARPLRPPGGAAGRFGPLGGPLGDRLAAWGDRGSQVLRSTGAAPLKGLPLLAGAVLLGLALWRVSAGRGLLVQRKHAASG